MAGDIPNFGELLGPFIVAVPEASRPGFLARLERGAAERYRAWADAAPEAAEGLRACSAREDEIADRAEKVLPPDPAHAKALDDASPGARDAYYAVFAELPFREQLRIQAGAERQGAAAWRGIAATQTDEAVKRELEACAVLEEESASWLDKLLADPGIRLP